MAKTFVSSLFYSSNQDMYDGKIFVVFSFIHVIQEIVWNN